MDERSVIERVIGVDQGDRTSELCELDVRGEVVMRRRIRTTPAAYRKQFAGLLRTRVVIEVGPHSPWSSRLLQELGVEVVVANPRRVKLITQAERKSDRVDAEQLARLGRADVKLLAPVVHGSEAMQCDRALQRLRKGVVRCRTQLIHQVRGTLKALGERAPASRSAAFARRVREHALVERLPGLAPVLGALDQLTACIRELDAEVQRACEERHPATALLRQVTGVGPHTALAFVTTLEDPARFAKSRDVGPAIGLVPRIRESGESRPALGIPRRSDALLRESLVQAAHYILGPFGPDCTLRRFGLALIARQARHGKKRAVIAVARKLAVLLHRLWVTGEAYQPLDYAPPRGAAA
jgi:transposase